MGISTFVKMLEAPRPEGLTGGEGFLQNDDLLPVPMEQRTWASWNYYTFWVADSFNIKCVLVAPCKRSRADFRRSPCSTFQIASSMVTLGMTWWQAWVRYE